MAACCSGATTAQALKESGDACFDGLDNDADGFVDDEDIDCSAFVTCIGIPVKPRGRPASNATAHGSILVTQQQQHAASEQQQQPSGDLQLSISITDSLFTGNKGFYGAAVAVSGSATLKLASIVLERSIIAGNEAKTQGGALWLQGGDGAGTALRVVNSTFDHNRCRGGDGGAVWASGLSSVEATIAGGDVSSNWCDQGGGVLAYEGDVSLDISAASVEGNSATSGGVLESRASVALRILGGALVQGNVARASGGVVSFVGSPGSSVLVTDAARVLGNQAGLDGGFVSASQLSSVAITGDADVAECRAGRDGGAVAVIELGELVVAQGGGLSRNSALRNGGAFIVSRALDKLEVSGANTSITGNRAGQHGGVLSCGEADVENGGVRAVIIANGSRLEGNTALEGDGGVIWVMTNVGTLSAVGGVSLTGNTAGRHGGVLHAPYVGQLAVSGRVAFARNRATQGSGGVLSCGAVSNLDLGDVTLSENSAGVAGGVLALRIDSISSSANNRGPQGSGLQAASNSAGEDGGVIYMAAAAAGNGGNSRVNDTSSCSLAVNGSALSSNSAGGAGGALAVSACALRVQASTFTDNSARTFGGGVALNLSAAAAAGAAAGGVWGTERSVCDELQLDQQQQVFSRAAVCACNMTANEAGMGGAIYALLRPQPQPDGMSAAHVMPVVTMGGGSILLGNWAAAGGGAIAAVAAIVNETAAADPASLRRHLAQQTPQGSSSDGKNNIGNTAQVVLHGVEARSNAAAGPGGALLASGGITVQCLDSEIRGNAAGLIDSRGGKAQALSTAAAQAAAAGATAALQTLLPRLTAGGYYVGSSGASSLGGSGGGFSVGGGMAVFDGASLFLQRVSMIGNVAAEAGGSLYGGNCSDLWISNSTVADSAAAWGPGGGLHATACQHVLLHAARVSGCNGTSGGGAYLDGGSINASSTAAAVHLALINNTMFTGNSAQGIDGHVGPPALGASDVSRSGVGGALHVGAELVSAAGDVVEGYPPVTLRLTLEPAAWVRLQPQVDAVTDQATGQAEWNQVVVHGWPGEVYTLRVAAVGTEDSVTGQQQLQQLWYASLLAPGADVLQQLRQARSLVDLSVDGNSSVVVTNSSAAALTDICVLTASADTKAVDDVVLYVNWQCAEGYVGRLCATCIPNLYLSSDFECQACPALGLNLFLGLLAFFANVVLMLYTSWTAYTDEGGAAAEEQAAAADPAGEDSPAAVASLSSPQQTPKARRRKDSGEEVGASEKLKVIIVHVQYFIIITRLNLNWPRIIHKLAAGFGTVTGASNFFTFAPSCFFPDYTSDGQARLTVFYSLAAPCLALLLCLALWALRWCWFNQSRMKRTSGRRYNGRGRRNDRSHRGLSTRDLAALSALEAAEADTEGNWPASASGGVEGLSQAAAVASSPPYYSATAATAAELGISCAQIMPPPPPPPPPPLLPPPAPSPPALITPAAAAWDPTHLRLDLPAAVEHSSSAFVGGGLQAAAVTPRSSAAATPAAAAASIAPPGRSSTSGLKAIIGKLRSNAGMRHLDQTVSLPGQLLIVLLVGVFILYPGLVQASLSIFACRNLDDGSGPYPEAQTATWRYGYWMKDLEARCYAETHAALYLPLGIVSVVLFCCAPPLAFFIMLWRKRESLEEPHTKQVYGFLYDRYRRSYYFYEGVRQLQTLALVCVDVFGYTLAVDRQALLLQAILVAIGAMNMTTNALRARVLAVMEFLSLSVLVLTM
ncbi:hypothetical protein HXX76_005163 [Chlamydomonas incerta]|uniref:EF-hand domain-containing protein n=1 Tax=Chlamydomonas incerta TaxID=51695 RepID=A0A835W662_CHLIN|nr:hypothetical protein HXX76_005163 [Chlamydomonas incerta]|eukprot:KAG2438614.1 hypothetical protein HXX76_005163 [Chlamydomonas incerta]